jgi:hypothetical protein
VAESIQCWSFHIWNGIFKLKQNFAFATPISHQRVVSVEQYFMYSYPGLKIPILAKQILFFYSLHTVTWLLQKVYQQLEKKDGGWDKAFRF